MSFQDLLARSRRGRVDAEVRAEYEARVLERLAAQTRERGVQGREKLRSLLEEGLPKQRSAPPAAPQLPPPPRLASVNLASAFLNPSLGRRRDDIGLGVEQMGQAVQDYLGYRYRVSEADRLEQQKYERDLARRRASTAEAADIYSPYLQEQTFEESVPQAGMAGRLAGEYPEYAARPDLAQAYVSQPRTVTRAPAENLADLLTRPELTSEQKATLLLPENVTSAGARLEEAFKTREKKKGEAYGELIGKIAAEAQTEAQSSGRYFAEVFPDKLMATVQAAPEGERLKIINAAMEMSQRWLPVAEKREGRAALNQAQSYIDGLIEAKTPRAEALRRGLQKFGASLSEGQVGILQKTYQPTVEEKAEELNLTERLTRAEKLATETEREKVTRPGKIETAVGQYRAMTGPVIERGVAQITAETKARVAQLAAELKVRDASDLQKRAVTAIAEAAAAGGPEGIRDPLMRQLYESEEGLLRNLTRYPLDVLRDIMNKVLGEGGPVGGKPGTEKPKAPPALPSQGRPAQPPTGAGAAPPARGAAPSVTVPRVAPPPPKAAREQALGQFRQELRATPDRGRRRAYVDRMVNFGYMSQREAEKLKAEFGLRD